MPGRWRAGTAWATTYTSLARWVAGPSGRLGEGMLLTQEVKDGVNVVQLHLDPERKGESFTTCRGGDVAAARAECHRRQDRAPALDGSGHAGDRGASGRHRDGVDDGGGAGIRPGGRCRRCACPTPRSSSRQNERGWQTLEKLGRATGGKERLEWRASGRIYHACRA